MTAAFRYQYLYRPGRTLSDAALASLAAELTALGRACLDPLPAYQVFLGTRAAFADKIITCARDPRDGRLRAFCSCVLLPMPGVGEVLHLGLTCVDPALRGSRLSMSLANRLLGRYVVTRRPVGRVWMTSVACVLQVCGNLAQHFRQVYPAPAHDAPYSDEVLRIAETFDRRYRDVAHVQPEAIFDRASFVFRGSGRGTAFQKSADATEFHHRDPAINAFYQARLRFDDGDELLQVICFSLWDLARYQLSNQLARGRRRATQRRGAAA